VSLQVINCTGTDNISGFKKLTQRTCYVNAAEYTLMFPKNYKTTTNVVLNIRCLAVSTASVTVVQNLCH